MSAFDSVKKKLIFDEDVMPASTLPSAAAAHDDFLQLLDNNDEAAALPQFQHSVSAGAQPKMK